MLAAETLLQAGCEHLKCTELEVIELSYALSRVIENGTQLSNVALALQIVGAGGVDDHAQTMNQESEWMLEILPKLREALSETE